MYEKINDKLQAKKDPTALLEIVSRNPTELTLNEAAQLLERMMLNSAYMPHVETIVNLFPGVAWVTDPDTLTNLLTSETIEMKFTDLQLVINTFPENFTALINGAVSTCLSILRPENEMEDRRFNHRCIAYFASRLVGVDVARYFKNKASSRQKYFAHLTHSEEPKKRKKKSDTSIPELTGWEEETFLPLRIHSHFETLVRLVGGFYELNIDEENKKSQSIVRLLNQELTTYFLDNIIKRARKLLKNRNSSNENEVLQSIVNLIKCCAERLNEGDSLIIETGSKTHSMYTQFYRMPKKKSLEVVVHDRRDHENPLQSVAYLGFVENIDSLNKYLFFYLNYSLNLKKLKNEDFYKKLKNIKNCMFRADGDASRWPPPLRDQTVGNCVVASHDNALLFTTNQELAFFLRHHEQALVADLTRHDALQREIFDQKEWGKSKIPLLSELTSNHACYDKAYFKDALRNPTSAQYQKMSVPMRTKALQNIISDLNKSKKKITKYREMAKKDSSEENRLKYKTKIEDYSNEYNSLVTCISRIENIPDEALNHLFNLVTGDFPYRSPDVFDAIMTKFVAADGLLSDEHYKQCYNHVMKSFGCGYSHGDTYVFFPMQINI